MSERDEEGGSREGLKVDVAVVGGGPTGGLAALCAADAGWQTALVAPEVDHDPRTTALLMPAIELMDRLGVWPLCREAAAPLVTMRLIDDTGRLPRAPEIAFDAHEAGIDQFGFNIPNDALNAALAERLAAVEVVRVPAAATDLAPGVPVRIATPSGDVEAAFVVGADGAQSITREACGFEVRQWSYEQAAFVTTLSHERPHGDTSTEFHTATGPFTLVPLPGDRSSLVWVDRPQESERRATLDPGPLARQIEERSHRLLGRMSVDGPRGVLPMEALIARSFGRVNVVLAGEAAHKFPPIGAQGLNLGMRDCAVLHRLLTEARTKGALDGVAGAYDRQRRIDISARTVGVDLLNRSLLTDQMAVSALRALALSAARNVNPLRRAMMRFGLG